MAQDIPLKPGEPNYRMTVPLQNASGGSTTYHFDFYYNIRDTFYWFNMFEENETPIVHGVRVVLGAYLGKRARHPFFKENVIVAIDLAHSGTNKAREATLADFGTRVILRVFTVYDVLVGRGILPSNLSPSTERTNE